jgi:hypothetical protein
MCRYILRTLHATIVAVAVSIEAAPSTHASIDVGPSLIVPDGVRRNNGVRKAPAQKDQNQQGASDPAVRRVGVQVTANGNPTVADEVATKALPKPLEICDVSQLQFDRSKVHVDSFFEPFIPDHTLKIGYAPALPKCGSTEAQAMLRTLTNNSKANLSLSEAVASNYTFISFLRHPMDRALAGFHQAEVFYLMGWYDWAIEKHNLNWWNDSCINTTFGVRKRKHTCAGSEPKSDLDTRTRRLIRYLDEVQRVGFFDQHHAPLTYLLARWEEQLALAGTENRLEFQSLPSLGSGATKNRLKTLFFDLALLDDVSSTLATKASTPFNPRHAMSRNSETGDLNWIVTWQELLSSASEDANTARRLLCDIYEKDVRCLAKAWPSAESACDLAVQAKVAGFAA